MLLFLLRELYPRKSTKFSITQYQLLLFAEGEFSKESHASRLYIFLLLKLDNCLFVCLCMHTMCMCIYIYTVGRQLSERVGTEGVRITEMFG